MAHNPIITAPNASSEVQKSASDKGLHMMISNIQHAVLSQSSTQTGKICPAHVQKLATITNFMQY